MVSLWRCIGSTQHDMYMEDSASNIALDKAEHMAVKAIDIYGS